MGKNAIGSIQWPIPENPLQMQKSCRYLIHRPSCSFFVQNFVAMAMGGSVRKNAISSNRWHIPRTPYRCKNLLRKPSYSQFCPKFRCHGNEGGSGKNAIGSIRWPIPENPPIGAKISQKSFTQAKL